jgi:hypothetical protein
MDPTSASDHRDSGVTAILRAFGRCSTSSQEKQAPLAVGLPCELEH